MAAAVLASHAAVQRVEKTFEYLPDRFVKREVLPDYFQQYRGSSSEEQGGRRKRKGVYYGCVNKDDVALTFDDGIWYCTLLSICQRVHGGALESARQA